MAPEGIMCDSKGRRQTRVPPSYDSCEPHQHLAWHNNSKGTIVTCVTWQWTTALLLNLRFAQQDGNRVRYQKTSPSLSACVIMVVGGEPTTFHFLNQRNP